MICTCNGLTLRFIPSNQPASCLQFLLFVQATLKGAHISSSLVVRVQHVYVHCMGQQGGRKADCFSAHFSCTRQHATTHHILATITHDDVTRDSAYAICLSFSIEYSLFCAYHCTFVRLILFHTHLSLSPFHPFAHIPCVSHSHVHLSSLHVSYYSEHVYRQQSLVLMSV